MNKWILVKEDLPYIDQPVFYYFDVVGVFAGKYYGYEEDGHLFAGKSGFLTGDATHWMPRKTGDQLPSRPKEKKHG